MRGPRGLLTRADRLRVLTRIPYSGDHTFTVGLRDGPARAEGHTDDDAGRSCRLSEREKLTSRRSVLAVRASELVGRRQRGIPDENRGIAPVARQRRDGGESCGADRASELLMCRSRTRTPVAAPRWKLPPSTTECHRLDCTERQWNLVVSNVVFGLLVTSVGAGTIVGKTGRYKFFPLSGTVTMGLALYLMSRVGAGTSTLITSLSMVVLGAASDCAFARACAGADRADRPRLRRIARQGLPVVGARGDPRIPPRADSKGGAATWQRQGERSRSRRWLRNADAG